MPDGIASHADVRPDRESTLGPVTLAVIHWLETPHRTACAGAALSPMPLFGLIDDPEVVCAACFTQRAAQHASSTAGWCDICRLDAEILAPTIAKVSLFSILALVCSDCTIAEQKAIVRSRYDRVAGSRPRPCEQGGE
jgi:hypothetical protein